MNKHQKVTSEWIPVSERLPENAQHNGAFCPRYQVTTKYGVTEGGTILTKKAGMFCFGL